MTRHRHFVDRMLKHCFVHADYDRERPVKAIRYLCVFLSSLAMSDSVSAGAIPSQLHNKTIALVWGQSNTWRRLSDGVTGSSTPISDRQIYISSVGRTFVRQKWSSGRAGNKFENGPDSLSGRFSFDGNTMTNFMGREGLLWRVNVTFDPSFSSCSAVVTILKEGSVAKSHGTDGAEYENLSASVGSTSCSVKEGNAFAG